MGAAVALLWFCLFLLYLLTSGVASLVFFVLMIVVSAWAGRLVRERMHRR
jgi:hypothetical protein